MSERVKITAKTPEAKRKHTISRKQKTTRSQSMNPSVNHILHLQRTLGNQTVQRMITSGVLQAKLTIGQPNDKYEQEADRVSDQVMRMPEPRVQRQEEEEEELQLKPLAEQITPLVQRQIEPEEEEKEKEEEEEQILRTKGTSGQTPEVTPNLESRIQSLKGGGWPLSPSERAFFEPRFGHDFSQVRVHTDTSAAELARVVNSRAFTVRQDMVFGAGQYEPETDKGRRLLAHELTHVVQQTGASGKKIDRSNASFDLSPIGVHPLIQRDLAIEPPRPAAVGRVLTPAQMADAITFNNRVLGSIANSADIIEMIRDVIEINPLPTVVDEDFVNGVVQWQANFGLTQDGKLGPTTARPLFREIGAEGVGHGEVSQPPRYRPAGPINVPRAGARRARFDMSAEFKSDPRNGIFPSCCEVRQEIQWDAAFVAASVAAGHGAVPHPGFTATDPDNNWIEDRDPTKTRRLGYRRGQFSEGIPGNRYLDPAGRVNQAFGHRYEGSDEPSGFATDRGSWQFRLGVYDVCNGNRLLAYSPKLVVNWLSI